MFIFELMYGKKNGENLKDTYYSVHLQHYTNEETTYHNAFLSSHCHQYDFRENRDVDQ